MTNEQNPVTIILGASATGKTTLAKQMCLHKKSVWLQYLTGFGLSAINEETEIVVLDGINGNLSEIKAFINSNDLHIEHKGVHEPTVLQRPLTIVVSNAFKDSDFTDVPNATIIQLTTTPNNPY